MTVRQALAVGLLGFGVGTFALAGVARRAGLRLNLTSSIPRGLYHVVDQPPRRESIVLVCLPSAAANLARSRGYIRDGACDDGSSPIGKRIIAMVGDTIQLVDAGVIVNGRVLSNSAPLPRDSKGRPLPRLRVSRRVVLPNEVWLLSSHPRGYDSRYYGAVPAARIVARIEPLLTAR